MAYMNLAPFYAELQQKKQFDTSVRKGNGYIQDSEVAFAMLKERRYDPEAIAADKKHSVLCNQKKPHHWNVSRTYKHTHTTHTHSAHIHSRACGTHVCNTLAHMGVQTATNTCERPFIVLQDLLTARSDLLQTLSSAETYKVPSLSKHLTHARA